MITVCLQTTVIIYFQASHAGVVCYLFGLILFIKKIVCSLILFKLKVFICFYVIVSLQNQAQAPGYGDERDNLLQHLTQIHRE